MFGKYTSDPFTTKEQKFLQAITKVQEAIQASNCFSFVPVKVCTSTGSYTRILKINNKTNDVINSIWLDNSGSVIPQPDLSTLINC